MVPSEFVASEAKTKVAEVELGSDAGATLEVKGGSAYEAELT